MKKTKAKPYAKISKKMDIPYIRNALHEGRRVTMLLRHAERPPLEPGDTSFGEHLALTARGVATARRLGASLPCEIPREGMRTYAGNTLRTIQTAACLNAARVGLKGSTSCAIPDVPELGSGSPYFGNLDERMALIAEGKYRERLNEYFRAGTQRGYNPHAEATNRMEAALERLAAVDKALVIAVTHDINIAAFLAGRGVVMEFDEALWPRYLDAAVMIRNDDGDVEYGYFRYDSTLPAMLAAG